MLRIALFSTLAFTTPAHAWNALAHKVTAEIAWHRLHEDTRQEIVAILRRHSMVHENRQHQARAFLHAG